MRHYMVDPDNEERLLKIPPHVVKCIKTEAHAEAMKAIKVQTAAMWSYPKNDADRTAIWLDDAPAAIKVLDGAS